MHLDFQYTQDDYREMLAAHGQQQQKWTRLEQHSAKRRVRRLIASAIIGLGVFLCLSYAGPLRQTFFPDVDRLAVKLLVPMFCFIVVTWGALVAVRWAQSGRQGWVRGGVIRVLPKVLLPMALLALCIAVLSMPDLLSPNRGPFVDSWGDDLRLAAQDLVVLLAPWVCIAIFVWWLLYRSIARAIHWDTAAHLHRPKNMEISPEGLNMEDAVSRSELKWMAISEFAESKHLFLLYLSRQQCWIIPKRALSDTDLSTFRQLLQTRIGDGSRPAAFEVLPIAQLTPPPAPAPTRRLT